MRGLRSRGNRIGGWFVPVECVLPVQWNNGVEGVMHCDVHHRVGTNALKGTELIFSKCNVIDHLVPGYNQSTIDISRLSQCALLLSMIFVARTTVFEIGCGPILRYCR